MDNLEVYSNKSVVTFYAASADLLPPERRALAGLLRPGLAILDMGVGGGRTTAHLAPGAARYLGADYSPAMVEACRRRFPGNEFIVADASDLSMLGDDEFDLAVFSFNGIDYLPTDQARRRALAELARVTRPDGHIIISSHNARQLVQPPMLAGADLPHKAWRILRAAGRSIVQTGRALTSGWFWRGRGFMVDPVHGGLRTHVSTPSSIAADAAAVELAVTQVINAAASSRLPEWANGWNTYVLRRVAA